MTVVLLSRDLTVLSRVEGAAARHGQTVRIASTGSQALDCCNTENAEELIVDLALPSLDITTLVNQLKSTETCSTRVIAFGPHVHEERLAAAQGAGCDLVVSRGQFFSQLDLLLKS